MSVSKHRNRWRVQKYINGCNITCGEFIDKKIAERINEEMEKINWDKSQYWRIRAEVLGLI